MGHGETYITWASEGCLSTKAKEHKRKEMGNGK